MEIEARLQDVRQRIADVAEKSGRKAADVALVAVSKTFEAEAIQPVIDAVEDTNVKTADLDATSYKLIGNVPASGKAPGGVLRHKGWRAATVDLPAAAPGNILAPAELEIE